MFLNNGKHGQGTHCTKMGADKVSFFGQWSKMQIIPLKNFIIKTWFIQFLWFFRLKCWFKGQIISRIHLSLPNAYKLMCFDKNINGNGDDKFFEWDYWSLHWPRKLTLVSTEKSSGFRWKKASLGVRSPCLQHYSQNPNHRWMGERKGRRKLSYLIFLFYSILKYSEKILSFY